MARNGALVPESKSKLESLKSEAASSLNVTLKQGYNGDLTSREAGSVGGEMVKRMIAYAQNNMKYPGHGRPRSKRRGQRTGAQEFARPFPFSASVTAARFPPRSSDPPASAGGAGGGTARRRRLARRTAS